MELDSELAQELERAIPHLPTTPASSLLAAGRRARRRRRAGAGVAAVAVLALGTGAAAAMLGDSTPSTAKESQTADSTPGPDIPEWAQEYGNHGPASIYPDGRLWVAPDARLIRSVDIHLQTNRDDIISSYAVEAEMDGEVDWSFVYRDASGVFGEMDDPGRWTNDFDVWIADVTSNLEHRPSFAEQLVRFAPEEGSEQLVARPGVVIVDQTDDVVLPNWEKHPGSAVAEVTFEGRTWFVLAMAPAHNKPFYAAYEEDVVQASTLEGFLDFLRDDGTDK